MGFLGNTEEIGMCVAFLKLRLQRSHIRYFNPNYGFMSEMHANLFLNFRGKTIPCIVEADPYARLSGLTSIEFYNRIECMESGATTNDYKLWFHAISEDEIYFTTPEKLKEFIDTNIPIKTNITNNGTAFKVYDTEKVISEIFSAVSTRNLIPQIKEIKGIPNKLIKRDKRRTQKMFARQGKPRHLSVA